MSVVYATLVSFNPAAATASVRIDGSAMQTVDNVPVSPGVPVEALTAGRRVLVETGQSGELGELLLYAADGPAKPAAGRATALLDVVNSAVETSLFSLSLPANYLATDRALRLTLTGDYLNNSGVTATLRVRLKLGATTLWDDTSVAIATNAVRRALRAELLVANRGATNSQAAGGRLDISALPATTGLGDFAGAPAAAGAVFHGVATEDTTQARTLDLTVQHSAANANLSVRRLYAVAELL